MGQIKAVSPATRAILRAVALLGSAQGLGMVCSLVRNKLVAVWMGPAGVAILGVLNAAVEMASALAQQGIRTSSISSITGAADEERRRHVAAVVTGYALIIGVAGAAVLALASPWLSRLSFGSPSFAIYFIIAAIAVMLNAFIASRQAIAQGTGRLARLARASLIGSVGGLAVSVPVIYFMRADGMPWVIVAYSVATAAAYLFPRLWLPRLPLRRVISEGTPMVRIGVWLTLSSVVDWGVGYLFMAWLHAHGGDTAVGLYQSGYTVAIRYMGILFSAIAMEFYPRLTLRARRGPRHPSLLIAHEAGVVMRLAVPAAALLIILAEPVVRLLYSSSFAEAAPFVAGALAATPLRALSWCVAFMLIARGDGRAYLMVELAGGVVCFGLSAAGYALWGMAGLGAAFIGWYLLYTVIVLTACRRRYALSLPRRTVCAAFISTLLLALLAIASTIITHKLA